MSTQIVELVEQGHAVSVGRVDRVRGGYLSRAEEVALDAAVEGTAGLGQRILQLMWRRRDREGWAALESAVQVADEDPDPDVTDAAGALREDVELLRELAVLLSGQGSATLNVSGTRAIGAQHIGITASGDNTVIHPPQQ
ncbi:hypothetical protein ACFWWC_02635 [Streptomyces sp. NPDC058642]|uniref:hypothetical protein n=1 Tax=Streptomyces sp. NPDC058642 TaxID=3346572 RepID=UPI00365BF5E5